MKGEQISGTSYIFTRDHLGSIREMVGSSGLAARYDYDPWGRRVKTTGSGVEGDFGFTGHYFHAPSGLHLALYRAYSAELGRWLSRDPNATPLVQMEISFFEQETGNGQSSYYYGGRTIDSETGRSESEISPSLTTQLKPYSYVSNDPTSLVDPVGLEEVPEVDKECMKKCLKKNAPWLWGAGGIAIGGTVAGLIIAPGLPAKAVTVGISFCAGGYLFTKIWEDCAKECAKKKP